MRNRGVAAAALRARRLDLDGEQVVRRRHRLVRGAVREPARERVRARDELPRGGASEPAELHRRDVRQHAGHHRRRRRPRRTRSASRASTARSRPRARRGATTRRARPATARSRRAASTRSSTIRRRTTRASAATAPSGRPDGDDVGRQLPHRPCERHAAGVLVRHAEPLQRHARLLGRDRRRVAPVVVREDPRVAELPRRRHGRLPDVGRGRRLGVESHSDDRRQPVHAGGHRVGDVVRLTTRC